MIEDSPGYLALFFGGLSIAYGIHAIATGANVMSSVRLERTDKPVMFWLVTGIELLMGAALARLGAQLLDWV